MASEYAIRVEVKAGVVTRTCAIDRAFSSHPPSQRRAVLLQEAINDLLPVRPVYAIANGELEATKAAIVERYGSMAEDPEEMTTPEFVEH